MTRALPVVTPGLISQESGSDFIVLDPALNRASALNPSGRSVFLACQSDSGAREGLDARLGELAVDQALAELAGAGLIVEPHDVSRRALLRRSALVSGAVGCAVIGSIVLPQAASALSGMPPGSTPGGGTGGTGGTGGAGGAPGTVAPVAVLGESVTPPAKTTTTTKPTVTVKGTSVNRKPTTPAVAGRTLAYTGAPIATETLIGAGLVAAGAAAIVGSRKLAAPAPAQHPAQAPAAAQDV